MNVRLAAIAAVVVIVTASCSTTDPASDAAPGPSAETIGSSGTAADTASTTLPPLTTSPLNNDSPLIVGEAPTDGTIPAALVRGEVFVEAGCVRLRSDFGGTPVVVWPAETVWNEAEQSVLLDTGLRIPLGATLEGGGGYYSAAQIGEVMPSIAEAVADCLPAGTPLTAADQVVLTFPEYLSG